jgi:hypothetical protein
VKIHACLCSMPAISHMSLMCDWPGTGRRWNET